MTLQTQMLPENSHNFVKMIQTSFHKSLLMMKRRYDPEAINSHLNGRHQKSVPGSDQYEGVDLLLDIKGIIHNELVLQDQTSLGNSTVMF